MSDNHKYKHCSNCEHFWESREDLLSDPEITLVGYQPHFKELALGLILFNHYCGQTLAIKAESLLDVYSGPVFTERKTESEECTGYCKIQSELRPCPVECECAYIREILQIVKNWPKREK